MFGCGEQLFPTQELSTKNKEENHEEKENTRNVNGSRGSDDDHSMR